MAFPIPTVDAKAQKLPGSDVYRFSAFICIDEHHRRWAAVRINSEAIRAFSDSIEISEREAIADHRAAIQEWIAKGALAAGLDMPWSASDHDLMEYVNYEHLKLACGFELHLKARLIAAGYLLHCVDAANPKYKALSREQQDRPIAISEIAAIQDFHFDGKRNFLPGLTTKSLKFSWLTDKPAYRKALGLSDQALDIIRDYRELRNQIHLPGEVPETPGMQTFGKPMIEFLLPFLNSEIIDWSNNTIQKYDLRFRSIPRFQ